MIHEARSIANEGEKIDLDPFAFWPDVRSRLVGLGGTQEGENPDYVFHTLYASCGTGPIMFTVSFVGLRSVRGTLILRVHELPEVMGAHARQVALSQTQLTDLIRTGGRVTLSASARAGNHYALLGFIYGDTVATADALAIEVARRSPDPHDPDRPTRHQADGSRVGQAPQIVDEREGTLVTPVSQLCTARQVSEPVFSAVLDQIGGLRHLSTLDRWEHVFLARVLDRYDVARSSARGLGIGALGDPLPAWLARHGCVLTVTPANPPPTGVEIAPEIEVRDLDPAAIEGFAGYDFAWATRAGGVAGGDRQAVLKFIEEGLRTLKPGGLMTLVVPIDVAPREIGEDAGAVLRRPDIDRITMVLLSRGHRVAQLRPFGDALAERHGHETPMISAFGLIVQKAA